MEAVVTQVQLHWGVYGFWTVWLIVLGLLLVIGHKVSDSSAIGARVVSSKPYDVLGAIPDTAALLWIVMAVCIGMSTLFDVLDAPDYQSDWRVAALICCGSAVFMMVAPMADALAYRKEVESRRANG